jgi:hypothetical protein
MKFTLEFEYPHPSNPKEGKVAGFTRMLMQARKVLRERVEHPERFTGEPVPLKRRPGRPRKNVA